MSAALSRGRHLPEGERSEMVRHAPNGWGAGLLRSRGDHMPRRRVHQPVRPLRTMSRFRCWARGGGGRSGVGPTAHDAVCRWSEAVPEGHVLRGPGVSRDGLPLIPVTQRPMPRPRLALYHGGIVGAPALSSDCFRAYIKEIIDFVLYRGINVLLLELQMFTYSRKDASQNKFEYFSDPSFIADAVLKPLRGSGVEVGVVSYMRPKDGQWDFQYGPPGSSNPLPADFLGAPGFLRMDQSLLGDLRGVSRSPSARPLRRNARWTTFRRSPRAPVDVHWGPARQARHVRMRQG